MFLIDLPCSIPGVVEALFYYPDESDADLWRDAITYIP
jgi:hypothetical protein